VPPGVVGFYGQRLPKGKKTVNFLGVGRGRVLTRRLPLGKVLRMDLRTYLNSLSTEEQAAFAARVGTSVGYLRKAISIGSSFSPELAVAIERESGLKVTRKDLFPSRWQLIWPELSSLRTDLRPAVFAREETHGLRESLTKPSGSRA